MSQKSAGTPPELYRSVANPADCDGSRQNNLPNRATPRYQRLMTDHARAPHILVVDDHREIRDAVTRYLEKNGMRASAAKDVPEMDAALRAGRFDLVVLDVMMPGEDGLSAARRLAAAGGPPVLMLSALGEDTDRIVGLEVGADDYLVKPFNPRELLARVKAIMRRSDLASQLACALQGATHPRGMGSGHHTRALTHRDGARSRTPRRRANC